MGARARALSVFATWYRRFRNARAGLDLEAASRSGVRTWEQCGKSRTERTSRLTGSFPYGLRDLVEFQYWAGQGAGQRSRKAEE